MDEILIYLFLFIIGFLPIYFGYYHNTKKCPKCYERINKKAIKCPHCQSDLE